MSITEDIIIYLHQRFQKTNVPDQKEKKNVELSWHTLNILMYLYEQPK